MLTTKERHRVLLFLHSCSIFCLIPMRVYVSSWDVLPATDTRRKEWACKGAYVLFLTHTLYKVTSLLYALFFCHHVPVHQLLIHGVFASAVFMIGYWYYQLFIADAYAYAGFVTMTLKGNITGGNL